MKRVVLPSLVTLFGAAGVVRVVTLQERLHELERRPSADPTTVADLERELAHLTVELSRAREHLQADDRVERLGDRLAWVETVVADAGADLAEQDARLEAWEQAWSRVDPLAVDAGLTGMRDALVDETTRLEELARGASVDARESLRRVEELDRALLARRRDTRDMWDGLMGPTVQISGQSTVGSGILLGSSPHADGRGSETHVLTAWHVVRDIYSEPDKRDRTVPVKIYDRDGTTRLEDATLVVHDADLDAALLVLATREPVPHAASLAQRERLDRVQVFDPVYAAGCPLGNDPIPTYGEVASTHHEVDGDPYWMISAPTYIGNSGGGVFDAETHELLGIFSKIYTHGSMRATIVPHMGLVTPLDDIYDWLREQGYERFEARAAAEHVAAAGPR